MEIRMVDNEVGEHRMIFPNDEYNKGEDYINFLIEYSIRITTDILLLSV
jgi:hypothetical protein